MCGERCCGSSRTNASRLCCVSLSTCRWTRSLARSGSPSRRRSRASTARPGDFAPSSRWRRFSDMGREDFRRELRDGFESIAGPPDAGLTGRVHSALVEAPERRGPVWIAGLAAALIAAMAVGALFIAGPLRQQNQQPLPAGIATPSPLPTSDVSNLPALTCNNANTVSTEGHVGEPIAYVNAVRTGTHTGYDRITIQFQNGLPGDIQIATQDNATFTQGASGRQVVLQGSAGLLITMH